MTKLQHLNLDSNGLAGTIPDDLFKLSSLTYLNLARQSRNTRICTSSDGDHFEIFYDSDGEKHMGLAGRFFDSIKSLENLRWLVLNWNALTGELTPAIKNLKQLGKSVTCLDNEARLTTVFSLTIYIKKRC
jgi:hypothetical protein